MSQLKKSVVLSPHEGSNPSNTVGCARFYSEAPRKFLVLVVFVLFVLEKIIRCDRNGIIAVYHAHFGTLPPLCVRLTFKALWLVCVPPVLTLESSAFCLYGVFVFSVGSDLFAIPH
jgi:hypothetical protein